MTAPKVFISYSWSASEHEQWVVDVVVKYFRTAPREVMRFVQPLRASYSCYSYAGAGSCNS